MTKLIKAQNSNNSVHLYEGGDWVYMWTDRYGRANYQCQPVVSDPTCWPVWGWMTE